MNMFKTYDEKYNHVIEIFREIRKVLNELSNKELNELSEHIKENLLQEIKNENMTKEKLYYIQNGYVGNAILWWGIDSKGNTTEIDKAGKYTKKEAKSIIQRPQDIAWECNYVDKNLIAHKMIIDAQYLDRKKCLKGRSR